MKKALRSEYSGGIHEKTPLCGRDARKPGEERRQRKNHLHKERGGEELQKVAGRRSIKHTHLAREIVELLQNSR